MKVVLVVLSLGRMGRKKHQAGDDRPFTVLDRGRGGLSNDNQKKDRDKQKMFQNKNEETDHVESDEGWYSRDISENSENYNSSEDNGNTRGFAEIEEESFNQNKTFAEFDSLSTFATPEIGVAECGRLGRPCRLPRTIHPDPHNPSQVSDYISQYLKTNVIREKGELGKN